MAEGGTSDANAGGRGADPLLGQVLNERYRIVDCIGAGGMGRVYRAVQMPLGRIVAIKVVIPKLAADGQDPQFLKRFFLEASITSKLSHPHTITVFDYGSTADGLVYLAMEYLQGRTLQQVIATEGPQPAPCVVQVAAQIARSLREAHGQNVIHRDLKPSNVMLLRHGDDEWFVKVLDFGLVKFFGAPAENHPDAQDLTQEGLLVGSPRYIAPEQAHGHSDPRTDIYSLGIVMYQMLTGRTPFHGRTSIETIMLHVRQPVPAMQAPAGQPIPADVEAIVRRMLAKKPAERFQSMQEVLDAFARCSVGVGESSGLASGGGRLPLVDAPRARSTLPPIPHGSRPGLEVPQPVEPHKQEEALGSDEAFLGTRRRSLTWVVAAGVVSGVAVAAVIAGLLPLLHSPASAPKPSSAETPPASSVPAVVPLPANEQEPAPVSPPASEAVAAIEQPPPSVPVVFHLSSEPAGATVYEHGRILGVTPMDVERPAAEVPVTLKLKVRLEGHEPQTIEETSSGEERAIRVQLQRSKVRPVQPKPTPSQPGYKEDPY